MKNVVLATALFCGISPAFAYAQVGVEPLTEDQEGPQNLLSQFQKKIDTSAGMRMEQVLSSESSLALENKSQHLKIEPSSMRSPRDIRPMSKAKSLNMASPRTDLWMNITPFSANQPDIDPGFPMTLSFSDNVDLSSSARALTASGLSIDEGILEQMPTAEKFKSVVGDTQLSDSYDAFTLSLWSSIKDPSLSHYVDTAKRMSEFKFNASESLACKNSGQVEGDQLETVANSLVFDSSKNKSIYGLDDRITASQLKQLYTLSEGRSVSLSNSNSSKVICSGYLISSNWILTAGHCFEGITRPLDSIRVTSFANRNFHLTFGISDFWPRIDEATSFGATNEDNIDYVFIKLERDIPLGDSENAECVNYASPEFKDRVHVSGFPMDHLASKGPVVASGNVWFPYEVKKTDFASVISHALHSDMDYSRRKRFSESERRARLPNVHEKICAAYKTNGPYKNFISSDYEYITPRPRFGFDTDTTQRNSGSPVFGGSMCFRGVFAGGANDKLKGLTPNFISHEFATPIKNIIDHAKLQPLDQFTEDMDAEIRSATIASRKEILDIFDELNLKNRELLLSKSVLVRTLKN